MINAHITRHAVLTAAFCLIAPAAARAYSDPALIARQFIAAFDKGDAQAAAALLLADGVSITDEVPPYLWQGNGAFAGWAGALHDNDAKAGISHENVTLADTGRREAAGGVAYVVIPATFNFEQNGKAMAEQAQMAFVLKNVDGGWKIAAFTWAGPERAAPK